MISSPEMKANDSYLIAVWPGHSHLLRHIGIPLTPGLREEPQNLLGGEAVEQPWRLHPFWTACGQDGARLRACPLPINAIFDAASPRPHPPKQSLGRRTSPFFHPRRDPPASRKVIMTHADLLAD
jgi:hypothetical protein